MIAMSSADGSPSKTARKMNGTSSNVRDRAASIERILCGQEPQRYVSVH